MHERGAAIAKPSVFVVDPAFTVRYAAVGTVVSRIAAAEVLSILQPERDAAPIRRKSYLPVPAIGYAPFETTFEKPEENTEARAENSNATEITSSLED
jgi:hypothetical protein